MGLEPEKSYSREGFGFLGEVRYHHKSGQIIRTSAEVTPQGSVFGREKHFISGQIYRLFFFLGPKNLNCFVVFGVQG